MSQSYHCTPEQRVQLVSQLLAGAGSYGVVSRLQRQSAVSRHTLYTWRARAHQALLASFSAPPLSAPPSVDRVRAILTLLVDTHASYRGIQHAMRTLGCGSVSLRTISAVVRDAERRAQHWLATHAPTTMRNIALDELYGSRQRTACLSIVDTQSWAVWAVGGPVNVDGESWTLLLWQAQASGLRWSTTISDGERAIQQACQAVDPQGTHGRDVWHVLHECAQIQGRLDRQVGQLEAQAVTVGRQVARLAAGRKPMGRTPHTDLVAHQVRLAHARQMAQGFHYLGSQLRELLAVVLRRGGQVLGHAQRQQELGVARSLLQELAAATPRPLQADLEKYHHHLALALADLLHFSRALEPVQERARETLGAAAVDLLGWAWQRRQELGYDQAGLLADVPAEWRTLGAELLSAWAGATRASSAVENWHSILRPHVAVHRELGAGFVALLAVWHNHRVFERGVHAGQSPVQLSGMTERPVDWLEALGYAASDGGLSLVPAPPAMALAA
jgi:transposase-like protein